jgi:predicted nucleic acid-binding protein
MVSGLMFIDSNIFLNAFLNSSKDADSSIKFLKRVDKGEQNASTSPLVIDEVLYVMLEKRGIDAAEDSWESIQKIRNLSFLDIDIKTLGNLMLFLKQGLYPRDAFHAATMKSNGISVICSFDKDFDRVKGIQRQTPK